MLLKLCSIGINVLNLQRKGGNYFRLTNRVNYFNGNQKGVVPLDTYFNHYLNLSLPHDKILATYIWIDGSGINLRSKDRVLDKPPSELSSVPKWSFDGSSTGQASTQDSDTTLIPTAVYRDPFRKSPHILVLCETYYGDDTPTSTNHRANCVKILSKISNQEPWFGIEQEYTMFDRDMWPIG